MEAKAINRLQRCVCSCENNQLRSVEWWRRLPTYLILVKDSLVEAVGVRKDAVQTTAHILDELEALFVHLCSTMRKRRVSERLAAAVV